MNNLESRLINQLVYWVLWNTSKYFESAINFFEACIPINGLGNRPEIVIYCAANVMLWLVDAQIFPILSNQLAKNFLWQSADRLALRWSESPTPDRPRESPAPF